MVFGRLKKNRTPATEDPAAEVTGAERQPESSGDAGTASGPFDVSDKESAEGYIDLGALRVPAVHNLQLRLEVEERTKRVIAVTLDLNGANLQLQAFAAPRSEGLWKEIREQISGSVGAQGGEVHERDGIFGPELVAKLPAQTPDGLSGHREARFVGVDGPRWFLRGVFGGAAAGTGDAEDNNDKAAPLEEVFRSIVVVRGDHPLPPRELLPLRLPKDPNAQKQDDAAAARPAATMDNPIKRGPEITHIG